MSGSIQKKHGYIPALGASQHVFLLEYIYQAFISHNDQDIEIEYIQQPKKKKKVLREISKILAYELIKQPVR